MGFVETVLASTVGFLFATFIKAFVDSYVTKSSLVVEQRRSDVEEAIQVVIELKEMGMKYWSTDSSSSSDELKKIEAGLQGRLLYLGKLVEEVFESDVMLSSQVNLALNTLDEKITGGDFKGAERKCDFGRCSSIATYGYALRHSINSCQRKLKMPLLAKH